MTLGRRGARTGSLGRRLMFAAGIHTLLVLGGALSMFMLQRNLERELARATAEFVEEQWIGDRLRTAVMSQLVAAATHHHTPAPMVEAEFREAGDAAYAEIRRYLFRDLSPAQRRQLEKVKEEHQRLEVAAARSLELARRGLDREADEATRAMVQHGHALQAATNALLVMREADLAELRRRHAEQFRYLYWAGIVFAILLLALSGLLGRFLHRQLAVPLAELGAAARRIGDGDLSARVAEPGDDELAAVARSFNRMSDQLATARSDLEARNRQLRNAVARVHETHAELVQTEKLSAMGRMMAGLAHELNNPLASVLGYGELLRERVDDENVPREELRTEFVEPIAREAGRARELVHNLLRFTQRSDPSTGAVPLGDALDVVTRLRTFAFEQAGLTLRLDPAPDTWVISETQRLQQVLLNVVNNAFDALECDGRGHGTVRVRVEVLSHQVIVRVEDDGPGFADPRRVFEPFYTTKPVGKGTGLGLAMVHRFMEEAGGSVAVQNRREGGARVTLTFRRGDPQHAVEAAASGAPGLAPALRVLVVEDELPLRKLQARLLERVGARVRVAAGGHEARRILESEEMDLVVSDVKMPDGSGLDLFRWVERERPALVQRFLFVTGDIGDTAIAAIAHQRPTQFVNKPFQQAEYLARIATLTTGAGAR